MVVVPCKIILIPELTRLMIQVVKSGIHVFRIRTWALRFWNTVKIWNPRTRGARIYAGVQNQRRWVRNPRQLLYHIAWLYAVQSNPARVFTILTNWALHFILQVSYTALFSIVLITHFTRTQPRVEVGKRADRCVRTRLKATLCLLKRKRSGISWKMLLRNSHQ